MQHYIKYNFEYFIVLIILIGIIAMNKTFVYIGIGNLYITEFLLLTAISCIFAKVIYELLKEKTDLEYAPISMIVRHTWPILIILIFCITRLSLELNLGFQAIRHSMIFLYTICFFLLFVFSIRTEKQLSFINVYLLIIFSSLFNGIKIIIYKLVDYNFNFYEQERVFHVETDTICASIAILGLLVYKKDFMDKSKIFFFVLFLLNITILILTVKRSAMLGIVPPLIIYAYLNKNSINIKKVTFYILLFVLIIFIAIYATMYISSDSIEWFTNYLLNKFSLKENNTSWRITAWQIALDKFKSSPWLGIGYGAPILDMPVNNVDTKDPHNSFLAFMVRHGILLTGLYLVFIFKTYRLIFRNIRENVKNSIAYKNSIFICMGLTAMIIFSFFNVVMENQYEGIFYNFFLSGIYIMEFQKTPYTYTSSYRIAGSLSYISLIVIVGFVSLSFSPFNQEDKIYIYSEKTNLAIPVIHSSPDSHKVTLKSENGLNLCHDDSPIYYTELVWFLPPKALKSDMSGYSIVIESDNNLENAKFYTQTEDGSRHLLLKEEKDKKIVLNINKQSLLKTQELTVKHFVVALSDDKEIKNLSIRNIYLNKKQKK